MDIFIKTHIVKKGETLEEIATMYEIPEVTILRDFHNKMVPDHRNCIGWEIDSGFELFVPQKEDILKVLNARKNRVHEHFENQQKILLNRNFIFPFWKGRHVYKIEIIDEKGVHIFIFEIEHLKEVDEMFFIKINQKGLKFNDEDLDNSVEEMASDINKNFFPVELMMNKKGEIEKINELPNLQKNWKNNASDLYEFYEGEIGKMFLDEIQCRLSDKEKLRQFLNENLLWILVLNSYLGFYENGISEKKIKLLNCDFNVIHKVLQSELQDQIYTISQEISRQNEENEMVAEAEYRFNLKTNILQCAKIKLKDWFENLNIIITQTQ
ncbi:LysM peptidoglycan-binding domain-containing protein [Chryseobacterium sp. MMS23-Vi53]|uniref:LysM peptidoglycan-binding domain-containing protein n=1 Tax=Chryseobacterium sp. MMS23-Vi53 TaxID=3386644 RepID=UPI0039E83F8B